MFELKFHRIYLLSILCFISVLLSACATMTKEECVAADWRVVGEADGGKGYPPQKRFEGHVDACARANIVPDQTLWNKGYQKGLLRYCTPLNGLAEGRAGRTYHNVCPTDKAQAFIGGYQLGRTAHRLRAKISSLKSDIARKQRQISDTFETVAEMSEADRTSAELEIRSLNRDISRDQDEIADLSAQLALIERDIFEFRQRISGV